jgi:hypothetical protein
VASQTLLPHPRIDVPRACDTLSAVFPSFNVHHLLGPDERFIDESFDLLGCVVSMQDDT